MMSTTCCPPSPAASRSTASSMAAPFYGESSMVMYRKDLMEKAGLTMPDAPTWEFIARRPAR